MSQTIFNLHIETLSPVHIGSGRNLRGNFDYTVFTDERQMAVLDERKVFDLIGHDQLHRWLETIENGEDLLSYLRQRKPGLKPVDIASRVVSVKGKTPDLQSELREQIHLGAPLRPTIPGSSLKGAVKTAVLATLIRKEPNFVQQEENLWASGRRNKEVKDQQVLAHYLNQRENRNRRTGELEPNPNEDAFRFLRLSDVYFEQTCTLQARMANLSRDGWKWDDPRSPFVECIPAGQRSQTRLQFPADHVRLVREHNYMQKNLRYVSDPAYLFETINKHTAHLIQVELDFWLEEELDYTVMDDYIEQLQDFQAKVKACDSNTCILRLGYASGWESMTGRWAKDKDAFGDFILSEYSWDTVRIASRPKDERYDPSPFPKTRKTAGGMGPMGFVKMSFL